jgi:hypothetical protein
MMYAFPILIAAMLAYMYWLAGFSMRRDRILSQRSAKQLPETPPPEAPPEPS